jgi:hypothetical protein
LEQNKEVNVMASESFKTVWGFDPDDVEKAKQWVMPTGDFGNFGEKQSGDNFPNDQEVGIPFNFEAQVYELRRMFRL